VPTSREGHITDSVSDKQGVFRDWNHPFWFGRIAIDVGSPDHQGEPGDFRTAFRAERQISSRSGLRIGRIVPIILPYKRVNSRRYSLNKTVCAIKPAAWIRATVGQWQWSVIVIAAPNERRRSIWSFSNLAVCTIEPSAFWTRHSSTASSGYRVLPPATSCYFCFNFVGRITGYADVIITFGCRCTITCV
jgi:hypothetical protein